MNLKYLAILTAGTFVAGANADNAPQSTAKKPTPPVATAAAAAAKEDIQDLVFVNNGQLLRFRLHIQVDGKPASLAWDSFVNKIFAWYDRNDDKFLSPQEAARVPSPQVFGQGFNLIFNGRGGRGTVNFAEMDTNKDGKVSLDEFRAYLQKVGFNPVQVSIQPSSGEAQQLTDAFYKHVNAKNDGKLTRADLASAWDRLSKLDTDEDEIISAQELRAIPMNPYYAAPVAVMQPGMPQVQPGNPFIPLPAVGGTEAAVAVLMARWDADRRSFVGGTELRLSANIPQVAKNAMRKVEEDHMRSFLAKQPDLELVVMLGTISEGVARLMSFGTEPARVKTLRVNGKASPLESAAKVGSDGMLRVTLRDALIEYNRTEGGNRFDGTAQYYLNQFKMAAGEKKYLEKAELMDNPQLQFFVNVFDDLDRDGDGKLTIDELQAGFTLLEAGGKCQIHVMIVDQGRGIFDLIDTNHDGRISRRELLNVLKKFDELDRNKDGAIEASELPAQFQVTTSQGQPNGNFRVLAFNNGMAQNRAVPTRGPLWFRKMDRNGDGDVSEREFLGTPEEFKLIDTDGDGLISLAEAERFDAARKAKSSSK